MQAYSLSRHHYIWAPSPLLIATGGSIPLFCLEGVPAFRGASQDEAGLTRARTHTHTQALHTLHLKPQNSGQQLQEITKEDISGASTSGSHLEVPIAAVVQ